MFQIDNLKKKLENGGLAIGTHVKWREPSFSELFAMEGYDYIWIDGEHSALTLDMVTAQVRAAQANGAAAFYRVPWNDPGDDHYLCDGQLSAHLRQNSRQHAAEYPDVGFERCAGVPVSVCFQMGDLGRGAGNVPGHEHLCAGCIHPVFQGEYAAAFLPPALQPRDGAADHCMRKP